MKTITVTLLGLSVILALISTAQAGHGHKGHGHKGHGHMPCKKYMKKMEPTEEHKAMFKECKDNHGSHEHENKEEKMKKFAKFGICMLEKTKILENNKFNMDKYDSEIDAMFADAEKAALVKKETAACVPDANKEYVTEEEKTAVMKCMWKAKKTACKDGEAEA